MQFIEYANFCYLEDAKSSLKVGISLRFFTFMANYSFVGDSVPHAVNTLEWFYGCNNIRSKIIKFGFF